MPNNATDQITLEIIQNSLQATADEMFAVMKKTAISSIIYEVLDMDTGITDAAGALAYIDAVHYAPHCLIDVAALDCDFLVCSTYKFFGPHMGVLFGKREHLKRLQPYKVRPSTNEIPHRWEWGTMNHECIAGIAACVAIYFQ